jgi:hypothetical protein
MMKLRALIMIEFFDDDWDHQINSIKMIHRQIKMCEWFKLVLYRKINHMTSFEYNSSRMIIIFAIILSLIHDFRILNIMSHHISWHNVSRILSRDEKNRNIRWFVSLHFKHVQRTNLKRHRFHSARRWQKVFSSSSHRMSNSQYEWNKFFCITYRHVRSFFRATQTMFESIVVIAYHDSSLFWTQSRNFDFSLFAEIFLKQIDHVLHKMSNRHCLINVTRFFVYRINQICVFEILTSFSFNNRVEIHSNSSCNRLSIVISSISLQLDARLCSYYMNKNDIFIINSISLKNCMSTQLRDNVDTSIFFEQSANKDDFHCKLQEIWKIVCSTILTRFLRELEITSTTRRQRNDIIRICMQSILTNLWKRNVCNNLNFLFSSRRFQANDAISKRVQVQKCFVF